MTLVERMNEDMKNAMRGGPADKAKLGTLRMLLSSLKYAKIEKGSDLEDGDVVEVLRKALKQRHDSIEQYEKGNRTDLADKERAEVPIIEAYLPQSMSDDEARAALAAIVSEKGFTSKKDMGALMKEAMARHKGVLDGKRAQTLAQQLLP